MKSMHAPWYRGERGEYYVVAQVFLGALVAFGPRSWPGAPAATGGTALALELLGIVLMLAGLALALAGLFRLGGNLTPLPYPRDCATLVDSGAYAIVRHPIYSGLVLGGLGWASWTRGPLTLLWALVLFAFFDVKSRLEERWLVERFGEEYTRYRRRVKKLIPFVY